MKTIVMYYSWSGRTRALAKARAGEEDAALYEIKDQKKPNALVAYTAGCLSALCMKGTPILPLTVSLDEYERVVIMSPVWASHPVPAINTVLDALPREKQVAVVMVSASGKSKCRDQVERLIQGKACTLVSFEDTKG